jgi:hypothetical protein
MKMLPITLLMIAGSSLTALAQEAPQPKPFQLCQGTYSLCTFSECGPAQAQGNQITTACSCHVWQGYSVGTECEKPKTVDGQTMVRSRYYPIPGYGSCSNDQPWAMCLDMPCVVDSNDKTKASCTCSVENRKDVKQGQGEQKNYLVKYGSGCPTGIISSATVFDLNTITTWLENHQDDIPIQDFIIAPPHK